MKLNVMFGVILVCLVLHILIAGCGRREKVFEKWNNQTFMEFMDDSVSKDPERVCMWVDSMLPASADSLRYYRLLLLKAKAMMFRSEADSAMLCLNRVEDYCAASETEEDIRLRAEVWNVRGNVYSRIKASLDSALWAFRKAYGYALQGECRSSVPNLCMNLADVYVRKGRYDRGAFWYRHALLVCDSLQIPEEERFPVYYGLAQVNMELRNFERCDYFYDLAYRFYSHMKPYEQHIYLNNRGNSYYFRQDYETALEYFRRSLALANRYPSMEFERNLTMINLGEVFLLLNRMDSATYYLNRCHQFFHSIGNVSALYYIDTQLIELALKQGDMELATRRVNEAVDVGNVEPNMIRMRNNYLQHYYEEQGDYRRAYHYLQENLRIDDSTRNTWIRMKAAEIALQYSQDSTLMQKEISIRAKENQVLRLHQWLYAAVAGVLLLVILILVFLRGRERERWRMQMAMASLRLENVRNRISPHFIFNVLSHEVRIHPDRERENRSLMGLIKLFRRNLELTESVSVTLADELDFVSTYVDIESSVLGNQFVYTLKVDECIDRNAVRIPSMLIQIPVENAIKHGLLLKEGRRLLEIEVSRKGEAVVICVRDNGGGYKEKHTSWGTGTGLKVIAQTIQLLNSYNRSQLTMTVGNLPMGNDETGCEVCFVVPFDYSYQLKKEKKWTR